MFLDSLTPAERERLTRKENEKGLVIQTIADPVADGGPRTVSDAGLTWRLFVERFAAEARFDDTGQPAPRSGGMGWIKLPLPEGRYVNLYRSQGEQKIGAQMRFAGTEGEGAFAGLAADRKAIDREFAEADLPPLEWSAGEVPTLSRDVRSTLPWDDAREAKQRAWFALPDGRRQSRRWSLVAGSRESNRPIRSCEDVNGRRVSGSEL